MSHVAAQSRRSWLVALVTAISIAGCSSGPTRDARSVNDGYNQGGPGAFKMAQNGVSSAAACKSQAEAINVWNPRPYNALDYQYGCEKWFQDHHPGY